jgi:hypothetical protein
LASSLFVDDDDVGCDRLGHKDCGTLPSCHRNLPQPEGGSPNIELKVAPLLLSAQQRQPQAPQLCQKSAGAGQFHRLG